VEERTLRILEYNKVIEQLTEKAVSELGKKICKNLQPITEIRELQISLQETDEALTVNRLKGGISLDGIHDLNPSLQRLKIGGVLGELEFLNIKETLNTGKRLRKLILSIENIINLQQYLLQLADLEFIELRIKEIIDEDGAIVDDASPELKKIRNQIRTQEERLKEKLNQIIRSPNYQKMLQEPIITIRNDRYVIPIKQEYRGSISGIVHDQSASGATLFIEPQAVVEIGNSLRSLFLEEEKEKRKILTDLSNYCRPSSEEIEKYMEILAKIDFIFAKAQLAYSMKANYPKINLNGYFRLKKARHPLINQQEVVPIDVELGNDYKILVITGPNTGGKTVTLKTIGLLTLMGLSGLFIPAEEESEIALFSSIFADIGDEQSIEQNLSTFSSHMTYIIKIVEKADSNSLVLLDELGAGTDPLEGSALAISILDYLRSKEVRVVATTHYSELKAYAYNRFDVINASMEFDVETLSPTFRLLIGMPGRSNAFLIAKRLGLSQLIIEEAEKQISIEDKQIDKMIASIENQQKKVANERLIAEQLREEAERIQAELAKEKEKFEQEKDNLKELAKKEAENIVRKAKLKAEEIIQELKQFAEQEKSVIKEHKVIEIRKSLENALPRIEPKRPRITKKQRPIELGDIVKVISYGQKGTVLEKLENNEYLVQIGIMKVKLKKDELEIVEEKEKELKPVTMIKRTKEEFRAEIDVRGLTVDEAIPKIDMYLDEAFLNGYPQVSIIHGKGTGALRQGLQEFLKRHKHVKTLRYGSYYEGGNGVTVVEIK